MRRFQLVTVVLLLVTGSVVALVSGQEQSRPRLLPSPASVPARLDSQFMEAQALQSESPQLPPLPVAEGESEIQMVAAPGDDDGGVTYTARRLFGPRSNPSGSQKMNPAPRTLPQGSMQANPPGKSRTSAVPEPQSPLGPDDTITLSPQEGVSSVLKKKPLTASSKPTVTTAPEIRTPAEQEVESPVVAPPANSTPPSVSSRRIGGIGKAPAIRSGNEAVSNPSDEPSTPVMDRSATPRATQTSEKLQLRGVAPHISVEASGPPSVTMGKPATYVILASNDTDMIVENVAVRIGLPGWVEVEGGEGTRGDARQETDAAGRQWLVWTMQDIAPQGKEQLMVNLTVQQPQPFGFAIHWTHKQGEVTTEIAVREPRLDLRLEGPGDMLHGEEKSFTLHVSNPGSGDTDNVVVEVMVGNTPSNRIPIGLLAAGEEKQIPFPVLANSRGEMEIRAAANAEAGLKANASAKVQIRKAELQVAVGAPELKFAGGEVTYEVAVANVGDAMAEQINLSVGLPAGSKYVGGIDGAASAGNALSLKMGNLPPGTEKVFDVRCVLTQAGENRLQASAQGKGDLAASDVGITRVEALADLKLIVNEPTGPMVVGSDAIYELHLVNRGTKAAGKVQVLVQFAQGIEPFEVAGCKAEVSDGQAIFDMLPEIAPGKELVMKVKSKVETTGNHAFRVEVKAADPETKLVSEGVTRCFDGGAIRAARKLNATGGDVKQR